MKPQAAVARGPVLPLYIVEPDLWRQGILTFSMHVLLKRA